MPKGKVVSIYIGPEAGAEMVQVNKVQAIAGNGLVGDRYYQGKGSFSKESVGKRQVTFMNAIFFDRSGFEYSDSRRNIFTNGVELMDLIGKQFIIGGVLFRGLKYCDPCMRPSKLSGIKKSFIETFFDRGGLVAEIQQSGMVHIGDAVTPIKKK